MKIVRFLLLFLFLLGFSTILLTGCTSQTGEATVTGVEQETVPTESTAEPPDGNVSVETEDLKEEIIQETTPMPTATPGVLYEYVELIVQKTGIKNRLIFGVQTNDWINLGISVGIIILGLLIVTPLGMKLLHSFFVKTPIKTDISLFEIAEKQLKLIINTFFFDIATNRLLFLPARIKNFFNHLYFLIYALAITIIVWKWLDILINHFIRGGESEREKKRTEMLRTLFNRSIRTILIITSLAFILGHFGVNMLAFSAVLGISGLALSLAAQDTLNDAINGFLILLDEPFRLGDRIEIQELETWGDVVDIGLRTTRIRTLDNRMVIMPNSKIGKSQIVNYSFPDTRYRVQTLIRINYGYDLETVKQIIRESMKMVDGVLHEKPVNVYLDSFDSSSISLKIRWWLNSFANRPENFDRVVSTIYNSLRESGIKMPVDSCEIYMKSGVTDENEK